MGAVAHDLAELFPSVVFDVEPIRLGDWSSHVVGVVPTRPITKIAKGLLAEARQDLAVKAARLRSVTSGFSEMGRAVGGRNIALIKREVREAEDRLETLRALANGQNVIDWERVVTPDEWLDIVAYFGCVDLGASPVPIGRGV